MLLVISFYAFLRLTLHRNDQTAGLFSISESVYVHSAIVHDRHLLLEEYCFIRAGSGKLDLE